MRCAICGKAIETLDPELGPFCSDRCRQVDLGRWLDERYTYPTGRDPSGESESDESQSDEPAGDGDGPAED